MPWFWFLYGAVLAWLPPVAGPYPCGIACGITCGIIPGVIPCGIITCGIIPGGIGTSMLPGGGKLDFQTSPASSAYLASPSYLAYSVVEAVAAAGTAVVAFPAGSAAADEGGCRCGKEQ